MIEIETKEQLSEYALERAVVLFTAPENCIPCRRVAPHFKAAAGVFTGVLWLYVDVGKEELANLAGEFGVMSVPDIRLFQNGEGTPLEGRTSVALINEVVDKLITQE